jgi:hypothetical protein
VSLPSITLPPGHPAPSPGGIRAYCTTCSLRVGQQYENAALLVWRTARGPAGPSKAVRPTGTLRTEGWQRFRAGCLAERLKQITDWCDALRPASSALCKTLILRDARSLCRASGFFAHASGLAATAPRGRAFARRPVGLASALRASDRRNSATSPHHSPLRGRARICLQAAKRTEQIRRPVNGRGHGRVRESQTIVSSVSEGTDYSSAPPRSCSPGHGRR